jgi:hypothetical protein
MEFVAIRQSSTGKQPNARMVMAKMGYNSPFELSYKNGTVILINNIY